MTTVHAETSVEPAYWGHQSAEVVLLCSDDRGRTFHVLPVSPPDDQVPNWLPSLECLTGHSLAGVPSMIYTHGHRGSNNREIVSNDVFWCDLKTLTRD